MLKADSVRAGHAYVNERTGAIREVVEELDRLRVKYNEFDLRTGELMPAPFRVAYKSQMARWAEREARAFEVSRLHRVNRPSWLDASKPGEMTQMETELRRANQEQVVGRNVLHRW